MSRLSLIFSVFLLPGSAATAGDRPVPGPDLAPERVVEIQLDALQHNDEPHEDAGIRQTWAFAHPANKAMTGPLERFTAMIKSPAYRMLVNHREHAIKRVAATADLVLLAVAVTPASGPIVFYQWQLGKVRSGELEGAWMTIAVSPPIRREDAI